MKFQRFPIPQTRNWSSKEKKLSNNDFSYCDSRKEEPLIFLGHFIRLWFNKFLQENMAWSFIEDFLMRMTFLLRGRNWRISNFMPRNFTKLRFYQNPSGCNLKSFQACHVTYNLLHEYVTGQSKPSTELDSELIGPLPKFMEEFLRWYVMWQA